jgi:photosystem II stability/assembly factor-like uncharacterized protein
MSPVNPDLIYGWYNGSLQQTVDGGNTWTIVKTNLANVIALVADSKDERIVYAATAKGAYISKDKGVTWSGISADIKNGAITTIAVDPSNSSKLLSFSEQIGLAMSENGGVTWKAVQTGIGDEIALFIAYDRNNPQSVYLLTHNNLVYKSTDGGYTWVKVNL